VISSTHHPQKVGQERRLENQASSLEWHAVQLARRRIGPPHRRLLREVADRVDAVLARLGRDRTAHGLIHADLHLGNVLDNHGQARPLDLDDASWGHYALDLAIAAERSGDAASGPAGRLPHHPSPAGGLSRA
jgi:Ser/Thr protein kinase RdoA (MazF antagonist)